MEKASSSSRKQTLEDEGLSSSMTSLKAAPSVEEVAKHRINGAEPSNSVGECTYTEDFPQESAANKSKKGEGVVEKSSQSSKQIEAPHAPSSQHALAQQKTPSGVSVALNGESHPPAATLPKGSPLKPVGGGVSTFLPPKNAHIQGNLPKVMNVFFKGYKTVEDGSAATSSSSSSKGGVNKQEKAVKQPSSSEFSRNSSSLADDSLTIRAPVDGVETTSSLPTAMAEDDAEIGSLSRLQEREGRTYTPHATQEKGGASSTHKSSSVSSTRGVFKAETALEVASLGSGANMVDGYNTDEEEEEDGRSPLVERVVSKASSSLSREKKEDVSLKRQSVDSAPEHSDLHAHARQSSHRESSTRSSRPSIQAIIENDKTHQPQSSSLQEQGSVLTVQPEASQGVSYVSSSTRPERTRGNDLSELPDRHSSAYHLHADRSLVKHEKSSSRAAHTSRYRSKEAETERMDDSNSILHQQSSSLADGAAYSSHRKAVSSLGEAAEEELPQSSRSLKMLRQHHIDARALEEGEITEEEEEEERERERDAGDREEAEEEEESMGGKRGSRRGERHGEEWRGERETAEDGRERMRRLKRREQAAFEKKAHRTRHNTTSYTLEEHPSSGGYIKAYKGVGSGGSYTHSGEGMSSSRDVVDTDRSHRHKHKRRRSLTPPRADQLERTRDEPPLRKQPYDAERFAAHYRQASGKTYAEQLAGGEGGFNEEGGAAKKSRKILSLEEMVERKKEESRPDRIMFLTKAQRVKLEEEREAQRIEEKKKRENEEVRARKDFLLQQDRNYEKERMEKMRDREQQKKPQRRDPRKAPEETTDRTRRDADKRKAAHDSATKSSLADLNLLNLPENEMRARQQEKELDQIREHYLGMRKEKKKIQKPSEKFRNIFNFEWDASEDTARGDNNPLYQNRLEPQLLFGRGYRAGIDVREQRKTNNFYDQLVKKRGDREADEFTSEDLMSTAIMKARDIASGDFDKKHWTEKKLDQMDERDWRIFREDFEIYNKGGRVPHPIRTWAESPLPWELLEAINKAGYKRPTPIQMQAIPIALQQRDLIGIAETGSGKTAAFVLPMLAYVKRLPMLTDQTSEDGPYALILAPSRELALQIDDETNKFASYCNCRSVAVVGGRSAEDQAFKLRKGAEIVIGTPGRVKDCLERRYTVLNQCNYVVLDEADRMIDMGFEEIVNEILDLIPTTNLKSEDDALMLQQELQAKAGHRLYRLTHMFSATMPPAVERLARKYLRGPAYISIGDPGAGKRAIEQRLEFIPEGKKKQRLQEVLEEAEPPVIIFVNQKKVADVIAKSIGKMGFNAVSLHGGKTQEAREAALDSFKKGEFDILVATDVAGRGIDIEGVQLVLNFDMPKEIEPYTHRIGRTGRAGKKGLAISFVTEESSDIFPDLKQLLLSTNNIVPMELNNYVASSKPKGGAAATAKKNQVVFKN